MTSTVEKIAGARRIAIVVGKNAWWPAVSAQVVRLAERLNAPVAHSWDGHAAMPTVHPLSIGVYRGAGGSHPAAWQAVADADLVLGIGVRPGTETAAQLAEQVGDRLLLIDAADEPDSALDDRRTLDHRARGSGRRAGGGVPPPRGRTQKLSPRCERARALQQRGIDIELDGYRDRRPWHIGVALDALARRMTPEILVVSDVSQVKLWTPLQIPAFNPESHLQPGSWGAMGYCVPGVLAAGLARPNKKIVGLTGDASFQMACSDFGTICNLGLPVVIAVHADGQIGMIHHALRTTFGRHLRDGDRPGGLRQVRRGVRGARHPRHGAVRDRRGMGRGARRRRPGAARTARRARLPLPLARQTAGGVGGSLKGM